MKQLIGMIHLGALPGTPRSEFKLEKLTEMALEEAFILEKAGFDSALIENMNDRPYLKGRATEDTVQAMTTIGATLRGKTKLRLGVQILAAANQEALRVAKEIDAEFIRVEGFVYGHIADEGWIDACAGELLRYRKKIGAEKIKIYADIKKKHASHAVTADLTLVDMAKAAEFNLADGVIVTGNFTGEPPSPPDVEQVVASISIPIFLGSGISPENVKSYPQKVHGIIVGSALKERGIWSNPMVPKEAQRMEKAFHAA